MQDLEAKRLRDSLVEYEGYLNEIRQVTLKNVETLDVIQRYTDKSAAGMQKLAEQSLDGIQRVTAESAGGLRRIIETGTSNLSQMAQSGHDSLSRMVTRSEESLNRMVQDSQESLSGMARDGQQSLGQMAQECQDSISRMAQDCQEHLNYTAQECLNRLQSYTEAGLAQIDEAQRKNMETAELVEHIEHAILEHMELMKQLLKQSDDFTHKENVKVYRNVQAVVVDEVKKQMEAMSSQNEELVRRNEDIQKQSRGLKPLMIVTLGAAIANIALLAAQIAGVF